MPGTQPAQDMPNKRPHPDEALDDDLPRDADSYEEEIEELWDRLERASSARKRHRQTIRDQDAALNRQQTQLQETARESAFWKQQCQVMKQQVDLQPAKDRQIQILEEKCRTLGVQLEEKESELRPMKALLSTQNEVSDADVMNAVDHINNLIEQMARENTERWLHLPTDPIQPRTSPKGVPPLVGNTLGDDFLQLLADIPTSAMYASLLLQFAWQAIIVEVSRQMLEMICFMHPKDHNRRRMTEDLAQAMETNEAQALYGHWRAMTHRTLRGMQSATRQASDLSFAVTFTMGCCRDVLQVLMGPGCPPHAAFQAVFQEPLCEVFQEVLKLARTAKEDAISKNYSAFAFVSDSEFCPRQMVLEEEEDSATLEDRVACTTRLGLSYTSKQGRANAEITEWVILQKAQVVTKAVLCELQEAADTSQVDQGTAEGNS